MPQKRVNIIYSGSVQGVGFRWTAAHLANNIGITGWVMNLPDGKVEVTAEGDENKLLKFIDEINTEMGGYISDKNVSWFEYTGEFSGFKIRHSWS